MLARKRGSDSFGAYEVVELLSQGATGDVYLGRSPGDEHTLVVVKALRADLLNNRRGRRLFASEVEATRGVDSAYTIKVIEAHARRWPRRPWFAMEYVEPPSLAEYVNTRGPLSPSDRKYSEVL